MEKKILLVVYDMAKPDGGVNDLVGMYATIEEAEEALEDMELENGMAQIVDLDSDLFYEELLNIVYRFKIIVCK